MSRRSIAVWSLGTLIALMFSTVPAWALVYPRLAFVGPEDPTMVLLALGGAGMAWQYFRSRIRK